MIQMDAWNSSDAMTRAISTLRKKGTGLLFLCYKSGTEYRWLRVMSVSDACPTDSSDYYFEQNKYATHDGQYIEDALWNPSEELIMYLGNGANITLKFKSLKDDVASLLYIPVGCISGVLLECLGEEWMWVRKGVTYLQPDELGNDRKCIRIPTTTRTVVSGMFGEAEMQYLAGDLDDGYVMSWYSSEPGRVILDDDDYMTGGLLGVLDDTDLEHLVLISEKTLGKVKARIAEFEYDVACPNAMEILVMAEMLEGMLDDMYPKDVDRNGLTFDADWCSVNMPLSAPTDLRRSVHILMTNIGGEWYIENVYYAPINTDTHIFTCVIMTPVMAEAIVKSYMKF